jgi:hypothetical protein
MTTMIDQYTVDLDQRRAEGEFHREHAHPGNETAFVSPAVSHFQPFIPSFSVLGLHSQRRKPVWIEESESQTNSLGRDMAQN